MKDYCETLEDTNSCHARSWGPKLDGFMGDFQPAEDVTFIMQTDVSGTVCWKKIVKAWQKSLYAGN